MMNDENRSGYSELHLCAHHGANADAEIGRLPNCDLRVAGCNRRVVQNASTGKRRLEMQYFKTAVLRRRAENNGLAVFASAAAIKGIEPINR